MCVERQLKPFYLIKKLASLFITASIPYITMMNEMYFLTTFFLPYQFSLSMFPTLFDLGGLVKFEHT